MARLAIRQQPLIRAVRGTESSISQPGRLDIRANSGHPVGWESPDQPNQHACQRSFSRQSQSRLRGSAVRAFPFLIDSYS